MKIKKDKGQLEYVLCFLTIFLACILIVILVNLSSYKMRKEHVENFVTDSTLAGAVIDIPRFQLTGHISNYDIEKAYNNFTTCLKNNLNLGQETRQNDIITGFRGSSNDLVISNEDEAVKITDFYLYNAEFENDDDDPGTFNVTKLIKDGQVYKDAKETVFAENADYASITLSQSTGKNKKIKLDKNTLSVYVRLEIKIKPFGTTVWGNNYFSDTTTGIHEYLVDVARNDIDYIDNKIHTDDEHSYVLIESINPTCTTDGKDIYVCECGETYTEVVKSTGHTEVKAGKENAHTKCDVCDIILSSDHEYNSSVIKETTCKEKGEVKYICDCGYSYIKYIDKLEHVEIFAGKENAHTKCSLCEEILNTEHDFEEIIISEPTCIKEGIVEYICECGYSYFGKISMVDHKYSETKIDKTTCDTEGGIQYTCNECGYTYLEITEKSSLHDFEEEIILEPTCTEKGKKKLTCTICGYEELSEIDISEHDYDTTIIEATCIEEGYSLHTCLVCGYNYTSDEISINPDNHMIKYVGTKEIHTQCEYCNEVLSTEHNFEYIVTKEPTCTETGLETYKCICGYYEGDIKTREVPASGHENIIEVLKKPTCTEKGQEKHICEICDYEEIVDIDELGHDYTSEVTLEPTCTEKGIRTYTCSCGDTYTEDIEALGHTEVNGGTKEVHIKCNRCNEILSTEHILKTTTTKEPTCTEKGIRTYTCECGYSYDEDIEALGHVEVNGGTKDAHVKCNRCNEILSTVHIFETTITKEPTYTETGNRKYTCNCGYTYTEILDRVVPESLEACTWAEISEISEVGLADDYFSIGDTKTMTLSNGETYNAEIIGFNHDDLADGTGTTGITFQFKELMTTTHVINSTQTNVGGWEASEMRTYVNNDVFALLPAELQTEIKTVDKISDAGNMDTSTLIHTSDKLFLLSLEEAGISSTYNVAGQGTQYEKFTDDESRVKYLSGSATTWGLRSAYTNSTYYFIYVNNGGSSDYNRANYTHGVAPAFCI